MRSQIWTVGLVGFLASLSGVILGVALVGPAPAEARSSYGTDDVVVATGNIRGGNEDVLYLLDTKAERLCVYEVEGRTLTLAAARNIKYDLQLHEWPTGQKPGLKELSRLTRDSPDPPPSGRRQILAVPGNFLSDQHDLLWVYDTQSRRLVVYEYNNKRLDVLAARMVTFDLKLDEHVQGKQKPAVKEVYEMIKK